MDLLTDEYIVHFAACMTERLTDCLSDLLIFIDWLNGGWLIGFWLID